MSVVNAIPLLLGDEGYNISRSVRLRSSASAFLNRTVATASNRKTWTWSAWVKRGALGTNHNLFGTGLISGTFHYHRIYFDSSDKLVVYFYPDTASAQVVTTQVFRDPSAWYHVVITWDTTDATAANRVKMWVNGSQITSFSTAVYPSQNTDGHINSTTYSNHRIGRFVDGGATDYLDGYLTEVNFIDGQALTPSSFGETDAITGVWKPKKYAGTYGTNGFYLNFSDNSSNTATTIGKDNSGNGNNWTPNNISVTAGVTYDSMIDVPTLYADGGNGRGNYCVVSPLDKNASITVANANLNATSSGGASWTSGRCSIAVSSGKWYWEIDESYSSGGPLIMGIADSAFNVFTQRAGDTAGSYVLAIDGNKGNNGTFTSYAGGSIASGRNIGVALDLDGGTLTFYNNGVSLGTAYSGISGTFAPVFSIYGTQGGTLNFNFGQRPFAYTPPTGFKALNTQNLPAPTILKGNKYFDISLYSGNNSTQSIVNSGSMQPDLVWIKSRNIGGANHVLTDSVRGVNKFLLSNLTDTEYNIANTLTAFNSNGFSLGNTAYDFNISGNNYVGWQWKANGSAVTNTSGSITSQVNAGTSQGFSVVTYTAQSSGTGTVGHGLGVAPSLIITKQRATTGSWTTYHAALGNTKYISLNLTNAATTGSTIWNNTSPTSSVFTLGSAFAGAGTMVAYCFSEVAGFSKFGSYTGNGSADGPFVFCGFRPRYILWKRTDTTSDWGVIDTARDTYNTIGYDLTPNASSAEGTGYTVDFLSNGFKIRLTATRINASGGTYIFAAFAESPFKNSLAR